MDNKITFFLNLIKRSELNEENPKILIYKNKDEFILSIEDTGYEWYGNNLEKVIDEAIESLDEIIKEDKEEQRKYKNQLDEDYYSVQGAKTGRVVCFWYMNILFL